MMNKKVYLFEGGHFGQRCDLDNNKEYRRLFKNHLRTRNMQEPEFYWREHCFRTHRERVERIEPEINTDSPRVAVCPLISENVFNRRLANLVRNERDNSILLKKIQTIYTQKGRIDNQLSPLTKSIHDTSKVRQRRILVETLQNCNIYRKLQAVKPTISRKEQLKWYEKQRKYQDLGSRFPLYKNSRMCAPFEKLAYAKAKENPRPIVYMDIEATDKLCGRIFMELFADTCPMTCENFRSLCAGDRGTSYICRPITAIRPKMFWRGGGVPGFVSIYGESFPNENHKIKHDKRGILSMTSHGPKTNNTEFQISAAAFPPLDGVYVAFGQVIQGMEFLEELAKVCRPTEHGKLRIPSKITVCGETTKEKMQEMHQPKLYKSHKAELVQAREVKGILQMQRRVQDLKAELEDLNREPSIPSEGSESDSDSGSGRDADTEDTF